MLEGKSWQNSRLMVARALGRSREANTEIDGLTGLRAAQFFPLCRRALQLRRLQWQTVPKDLCIPAIPPFVTFPLNRSRSNRPSGRTTIWR